MPEYIGQAIDILTCHYIELGSERGSVSYSTEQVEWALEIALQVMHKVMESED